MLAWLLGAVALLGLVGGAPAWAQQPCLKLVFNRYCLGGDVNLLSQQLPPSLRQEDGERVALVYFEGAERVYVLAWRARIYKVQRRYRVASQLRFDELYRLLRDKYGEGEDHSQFPSHARTPGRKQVAIRRGEGFASHVWTEPDGWHLELSWTREMGLSLAYVADELDRQQRAATQSGY
ncbi:hypothetical protein F2Q65_11285 [Thiohalocapsa marina]|uniref:Uncharacterized protein n=1 Tax=Thiohalocapsa marina TaxID=424902 RepID=A0A5M8FNG4_9GAMM|nr:hypothetical protein [Thiohalocapsa marina]KAA6184681.1 hypothetical protein F2Q65_11285 [Thiohalocapsa marina]